MTTETIQLPDFELTTTGYNLLRLSELKGKNIVLYFYPKDNTPGCTCEGQDFRDQHAEFIKKNTVILGVSRDNLNSHQKFKEKQNFPFELIADTDAKLCEHFGVIKEKNMYGKKVRGIDRSTFLFDTNGNLVHAWRGVKVNGHVAEVLGLCKG